MVTIYKYSVWIGEPFNISLDFERKPFKHSDGKKTYKDYCSISQLYKVLGYSSEDVFKTLIRRMSDRGTIAKDDWIGRFHGYSNNFGISIHTLLKIGGQKRKSKKQEAINEFMRILMNKLRKTRDYFDNLIWEFYSQGG